MISPSRAGFLTAALIAARATAAMLLPLTADEAYYWLWSKHLDFGYFDHPPAIAWLIRAGTMLFGDSAVGVRAAAILLSIAATWLVFESAVAVLGDRTRAWLAALLFNLTLMISAEMLAATPDMPSIACSALFLFALAKLQQSQTGAAAKAEANKAGAAAKAEANKAGAAAKADKAGRWWLLVGVAGGLGLLSKFSAGFLGLGVIVWMIADAQARRWLKTPWPWAGGVIALLLFAPNLLWQASHQWETFAFQFGRVAGSQLTGRFLIEFLGAQLGLATPGIFILGVAGLARARRGSPLFLLSALMLPAIAYFLIHALHDRVQGNWPSFLFPPFTILAASAFRDEGRFWRWCSWLAMPLAGLMLLLVYAQALTGILPLGKNDVAARLLARGFLPVAGSLPDAVRAAGAGAVIATDYETTAWLRFYQPSLTVIEAGEPWRYPNAPSPSLDLLSRPLLYVVEQRRDRRALLAEYFQLVEPVTVVQIKRNGAELSNYAIYRVEGSKGAIPSKLP